jgi:hypothetical protein
MGSAPTPTFALGLTVTRTVLPGGTAAREVPVYE